MILRLRTNHFRFVYTFDSGHKLVGMVEGDAYSNAPDLVFNLRSLNAICLDPEGNLVMGFNQVFGQFGLGNAEAIFSGSQTDQDSFFSFNYRNGEASIYDAITDTWIATGWNPHSWQVEAIAVAKSKPLVPRLNQPAWANRAIA